MQTETSAGIIVYRKTNEGLKFLVLYHGGRYWNFPKGKLEGESNFKAAIREVEEETGLSKKDLKFSDWFRVQDRFTFTKDREKIFKVVSYYLAETSNPKIQISKEHQGYGWFLYEDAVRILIHPNLRRNLKRAYDAIQKRSGAGPRSEGFPRARFSRNQKNPTRKGSDV